MGSRALIAVVAAALAGGALAGCGARDAERTVADAGATPRYELQPVDRLRRAPRAVDPAAGVRASFDPAAYDDETDPEALPQPLTDAELRRLLERSGIAHGPRAALTPDGLAVAPIDAPQVVQTVIQAANQIARLPYRYGGGHRTWIDTAYDCSASISYAFAAAGLLDRPLVSGQLAQWGEPGPGRWITIYANAEHAYMEVAGLRFDTSGLRQTGSRWQATPRAGDGFVVRHPPGL